MSETTGPGLRRLCFYTDGACSGNGRAGGGTMGAGIVGVAGSVRREWGIPLGRGTNQQAELLAIREALRKVLDRPHAAVRVYTDSAYAIGCLSGRWKVKVNRELVEEVLALARECARFSIEKVPGHAGHAENERADELATRAASTGEYYSGP